MDLQEQYTKLLRYCYMKTKDRYAAEDITQETFLRFWQSHSYKDTGREMAYLYTIARNLCLDHFRRPASLPLDELSELSADGQTEPESTLESIAIDEALEQIPEHLREIVIMRHMSEMSAADIGKVLGLSRFAVNRRLKEGLSLLKFILKEDPDE